MNQSFNRAKYQKKNTEEDEKWKKKKSHLISHLRVVGDNLWEYSKTEMRIQTRWQNYIQGVGSKHNTAMKKHYTSYLAILMLFVNS